MATGTLIGESIRPGTTLDGVPITVNKIERVEPDNISDEQIASGIPPRWTLLFFEVADDATPALADALAAILDEPGWYVDFHTADESFWSSRRRLPLREGRRRRAREGRGARPHPRRARRPDRLALAPARQQAALLGA